MLMETVRTDVAALKKLMIDNQFNSVGSLSAASGVHRNTLGKVLSGKAQPSADVMAKLVNTLKIPPDIAGTIFFSHDLRGA